jgi:serine/threonine-protein kinase
MDHSTRKRRATPPAPADGPDLVGETFADFRVLRRLGQGGMGQVYLAEQLSLKRKVAIKVVREAVAANPTALERFRAEATTVARLSHANVVQVHTVGEHAGRLYMVLEYVEGVSLRDYLERKGPLDVPLVLSLMRQVAGALQRAGELGIVHRDVKPENILLTRKGEAKVADFGLSRCLTADQPLDLTRSGTTVGTPLYMSPEQIEGKDTDARSDVYSFGVTCYYMLAGRTPFTGSNAFEIALKHVREEPPPLEEARPDAPAALCAVVRKMMAKRPDDRYPSARELLRDVARVRESVGGTTACVPVASLAAETIPPAGTPSPAPAPPRRRARRPSPRRRWAPALTALAALVVLAVAVLIARSLRPARPAENAAGPPPEGAAKDDGPQERAAALKKQEREEALRKAVEQHLKEAAPNPAGVEACIELGVLYLDQNRAGEAEALFRRMDERRAPSAYHFVGRLGLAVTDALKNDHRASHAKLVELFDPRSRDNRVQTLNDYLSKSPELARWVNEADDHNVRNGLSEPTVSRELRRFPSKTPFKRP